MLIRPRCKCNTRAQSSFFFFFLNKVYDYQSKNRWPVDRFAKASFFNGGQESVDSAKKTDKTSVTSCQLVINDTPRVLGNKIAITVLEWQNDRHNWHVSHRKSKRCDKIFVVEYLAINSNKCFVSFNQTRHSPL